MRLSLCGTLLLAGCHTMVLPQQQANLPVAIPTVQPMTLNSVDWQVMSVDELRHLLANNKSILFVLDTQNYNNLSLNLIEIERYIKEQKTIIALLDGIIAERAKSQQDK